jgi:predicted methyltransferase
VCSSDLDADEVFPDGIPGEAWDAATVAAIIKAETRNAEDLIHDWYLKPTLTLRVYGPNGEHSTAEMEW